MEKLVERDIISEMHNAYAIHVFSVAVTKWGLGILQSSEYAADVTGASSFCVRKWASVYYLSLVDTSPDDIDAEMVQSLLVSDRGRSKRSEILFHDEGFRLDAREFVRENGYVRGKPNMTCQMFRDWIHETQDLKISYETARRWLHELGFAQKYHHKRVYFDGH